MSEAREQSEREGAGDRPLRPGRSSPHRPGRPQKPDPVPPPRPFPPSPAPAPNPNPVPRPEPEPTPVPHVRAPGRRARKRWLRTLLAVTAGSVLASSAAIADEVPCESDALGETWCAKGAGGTAVVDTLGRVVCAAGMCVEYRDEWVCSTVPGGSAGTAPEGPVCDGDCRAPSTGECEKL